jgi:hypothetical protein
MPMLEAAAPLCTPDTLISADAGYHSDANLKTLAEQARPASRFIRTERTATTTAIWR